MAVSNTYLASHLSRFFIFNPLLGPTEETAAEKILFYYPQDVNLEEKNSNVGLRYGEKGEGEEGEGERGERVC